MSHFQIRPYWFSSVYVKSVDTHRLKALSGPAIDW